jgi:hypothetical protein
MLPNKLFIVFTLLCLAGCDLDKFTGYKYNSDPIPVNATIYGLITNRFTDVPVYRAGIRIENQSVLSDEKGEYLFQYRMSEDNLRDKRLIVFIAADKFYDLDTAISAYPQTRLDIRLEYGAPIIKRTARVDTVCQVIVFDYQGAADITSVAADFYYRRPGERPYSLKTKKYLHRVHIDSLYYAWYQTAVDTFITGFGNLTRTYYLRAMDNELFCDSTSSSAVESDTLLF